MSKTFLNEGDSIQVQGSAKNPYTIKLVGGVFSCDCPAWRNQSAKIDQRTCKHIKANVNNAPVITVVPATANAPMNTPSTTSGGKKPAVVKETAPGVLLAHPWDNETDLTGWWLSEKLDGVRAYWDGTKFVTRLGNTYNAPTWFTERFPKVPLDGELWVGRKRFQECVSTVRKMIPQDAEWEKIVFMVFDLPESTLPFEERQEELKKVIQNVPHTVWVEQFKCKGIDHLREKLRSVEGLGAEGLMARQPGSVYEHDRSHTLYKIKSFMDMEVKVVGIEAGKGKHKGRMGALNVELPNGKTFKVGTGFTDKERINPPKVGDTVTVRYQELSKDEIPRFPSFVAVRNYE